MISIPDAVNGRTLFMELIRNSKMIDKKYREFFVPTVLTAMSGSLILMADSVIVGNMLGANELAAVNCCMPVQQLLGMVSELLGLGGSTGISVARGRREGKKADQIFTAVLLMFAVLGLAFLLPQIFATSFFCGLLTQDGTLYPLVYEYYRILMWAAPFTIFMQTMEYILRAEGRPKLASFITILANVINIVLDIVFIGPLHMGIGGAALASVIGFAAGAFLSLGVLLLGKRTLRLCFGKLWSCCREVVTTGMPAAMGVGLIAIKIFCLNYIVTAVAGSDGMVAFSVCLGTLSVCSMFITASAQTMMPILGIYYGEKDWKGVRMVLKRTFRVMVLCAVGLTLFIEAAPGVILTLYGVKEAGAVAMAVPAIRIYAISLTGVSISFLMMYYYMTIEKQRLANMISVINGLLVIVPCAYVMSKLLGITGVWISFSMGELATILYIGLVAGGKIRNVYQISEEEASILDISLLGREELGAEVSGQVMEFLRQQGTEQKLSNKIGIAIEEMTENIYRYCDRQKVHIDLRLVADAEGLVLSFCDDGPEFDSTTYQPGEKELYAIDNIMMLKAVSRKMEYQRVIGLNKTTIYL